MPRILLAAILLLAIPAFAAAQEKQKRPYLLFLLSDDQRANGLSPCFRYGQAPVELQDA